MDKHHLRVPAPNMHDAWLQVHLVKSCVCCRVVESDKWYRWQDQETLPFSKKQVGWGWLGWCFCF